MLCSACGVDLSHLDSRALQMLSEPTFVATGQGVNMGFIVCVGPIGCTAWHMCQHWTYGRMC
jgi:predicted GNAT superfamily acetyltransferase